MMMAFKTINEEEDDFHEAVMMNDPRADKEDAILACERNGSLWELREMALTKGGLVNGELH